jgi:predicted HicB family RNase H-like nuclease
VLGTRDVVTFQGRSPAELRQAFRESIDDYLEFCRELNRPPDKPFSGKFMTRLSPALHKKLSMLADASGKSLNQFVGECLESVVASAGDEGSRRQKAAELMDHEHRTARRGKATGRRPEKKKKTAAGRGSV